MTSNLSELFWREKDCVPSQESCLRLNVKNSDSVKVKTVVGHQIVGVCGCVCAVAPLLITNYAVRYSKWLRALQTSVCSLLRSCKRSQKWQRCFQKLIFSNPLSHLLITTYLLSNCFSPLLCNMTNVLLSKSCFFLVLCLQYGGDRVQIVSLKSTWCWGYSPSCFLMSLYYPAAAFTSDIM